MKNKLALEFAWNTMMNDYKTNFVDKTWLEKTLKKLNIVFSINDDKTKQNKNLKLSYEDAAKKTEKLTLFLNACEESGANIQVDFIKNELNESSTQTLTKLFEDNLANINTLIFSMQVASKLDKDTLTNVYENIVFKKESETSITI
jgi:hypothetical protein